WETFGLWFHRKPDQKNGMARKLLRMAVGLYLLVAAPARAQDLEDVLAGVPVIGAALLEALRQAPDFMAKVEVQWTSQSSPKLATATGLCAWQHGHFRWDVNLRQVTGPLLSSQTLDVVNRMRLEPI